MSVDWEPPRCSHGNIILGCPRDDCPEQTIYLHQTDVAMDVWEARQQEDARRYVRAMLGLPL